MKPADNNYITKCAIKDAAIGLYNAGEINTGAIYMLVKDQLNVVRPYHGLSKEQINQYILEGIVEAMNN